MWTEKGGFPTENLRAIILGVDKGRDSVRKPTTSAVRPLLHDCCDAIPLQFAWVTGFIGSGLFHVVQIVTTKRTTSVVNLPIQTKFRIWLAF
ncbi:hypothetical protein Nepgr_000723 [Nepenthes gracilis]|uniref:Uncharacterized protein n=1 Tax=Nepenthes gracilis TaxID=150966 RepID=A0AAD3P6X5_NEPGR|nr:hypothetical protein Nepgr_000723 [Nepenthes gracilis]